MKLSHLVILSVPFWSPTFKTYHNGGGNWQQDKIIILSELLLFYAWLLTLSFFRCSMKTCNNQSIHKDAQIKAITRMQQSKQLDLQADIICKDRSSSITPTPTPRLVVVSLARVHLGWKTTFTTNRPNWQELTLHSRNLAWLPPCSVSMYLGTGNLVSSTCKTGVIYELKCDHDPHLLRISHRCL